MDQIPLSSNDQYKNKTASTSNAVYDDQSYKLENNKSQESKNSTVKKLIFAFIIVAVIIGTLAFGGVYFVIKDAMSLLGINDLTSLNSISTTPKPTVTPTSNSKLDSDNDGIIDVVEKAIGTNPGNMDTDADSYSDLTELKNGYDPIGTGKLTPNELQSVKNKIKSVDEIFYEKTFGAAANPTISSPNPMVNSTVSPKSNPAATILAKKDFSSPESTLKSFIASYETNDINPNLVRLTLAY